VQILADFVGHNEILAERRRDVGGEKNLPRLCRLDVLDRNGMKRDGLRLLGKEVAGIGEEAMLCPGLARYLNSARQQHFPQ